MAGLCLDDIPLDIALNNCREDYNPSLRLYNFQIISATPIIISDNNSIIDQISIYIFEPSFLRNPQTHATGVHFRVSLMSRYYLNIVVLCS